MRNRKKIELLQRISKFHRYERRIRPIVDRKPTVSNWMEVANQSIRRCLTFPDVDENAGDLKKNSMKVSSPPMLKLKQRVDDHWAPMEEDVEVYSIKFPAPSSIHSLQNHV